MKKMLLIVVAVLTFASYADDYAKAEKASKDANYKEAFELYKKFIFNLENSNSDKLTDAIYYGISSLESFKISEFDGFLEKVVEKYPKNWKVLKGVAWAYNHSNNHYGYIVAGKFYRGYHRGGGDIKYCYKRDKVRALQLYQQALKLVLKNGSNNDKASLCNQIAETYSGKQFQYLTDLTTLPDYEDEYYYNQSSKGASVDIDNNPIFYKIPASYADAKNDGERWRFFFNEAIKYDSASFKESVFVDIATYAESQFGVHTMAYLQSDKLKKDGPFAVHSLKDNETIAKCATGVQRFNLDEDYNYIKIYKQLVEEYNSGNACNKLITIYKNRRQYPQAVKYLKYAIEHFNYKHKQYELNQIIGNWGKFDQTNSKNAGMQANLSLKFRNATSVKFTAKKINMKQLFDDVKHYIKSNPTTLDWNKINIQDVGRKIVFKNETKYLEKTVAEWTKKLKPADNHFDKSITINPKITNAGAYLLTAQFANGNTSRIVLWLNDTVIIKKRLDKKTMYMVTDAKTGEPLSNKKITFFGYAQEYLNEKNWDKATGRRYDIHTKEFSAQTANNGIVILDDNALPRYLNINDHTVQYRWLTYINNDNPTAFLGFDSIWYSSNREYEYNQTKVFTITDRPVYRPDQSVKFKFWVGHTKYDKEDISIYANQVFTVIIKNSKGDELLKKKLTADEFGGLNGEFKLAKNATLGQYSIYLESYGSRGNFRVEEYKKPEYEVKIETPTKPVKLGDKISAKIIAKYYFGAPVTHAKVKYKVLRYSHNSQWYPQMPWDWFYGKGYWWFAYDYEWYPNFRHWGCFRPSPWWIYSRSMPPEVIMENEVKIDKDGTVTVEIDTALAKALHSDIDHRYEITAEVIDQSRRTIIGKGSVIAARTPFKIYTWVDKGFYKINDTIEASFSARTVDAKPVQSKGIVSLMKVSYDNDGTPSEKELQKWELSTNSTGQANLKFKVDKWGQYRIVYKLENPSNSKEIITGGYIFSVTNAADIAQVAKNYRFNDIELIPNKREYAPNEKVQLLINTKQENSTVLLFIRPSNGCYTTPKVIRLKGKSATYAIDITKKDMPNFFVEAITVSNGKLYSTIKEIIVPPEKRILNVEVLPSKTKYAPGEKAKVKLKITDYFNQPVKGSIVATVYDKSVEYISGGSNIPEIKEFFWKWRRRHNEKTTTNLHKYFYDLLKKDEKRMQTIGVFGEMVFGDDCDYSMVEPQSLGRRKMSKSKFCKKEMKADCEDEVASLEEPAPLSESDAEPVNQKVHIRKNFADTAFWTANLLADENGIAEIEIDMPENLTTWKIKVWSLFHGTKVGQGETEVITAKDFLIRLQAPRFFVEKDEVVLSAIVHNYSDSDKTTDVSIDLSDNFELLTPEKISVNIEANGEKRIDWRVKVISSGEGVITMKAFADSENNDAMQMKHPVLVHGIDKTVSFSGNIRQSKKSSEFSFIIPKERRPETTRLELRYSPTLAGSMVDALPYLVSYPYGCTEQTLNRFLPTVITQNVLKNMGLDLSEIKDKISNLNAQEIGDDKTRAADWKRTISRHHRSENPVFDSEKVADMVSEGIKQLEIMQNNDGGWGWFSGYNEYSYPHTTATVVRGLLIAKENEVKFDNNMLSKGLNWLSLYQSKEIQKIKNAPTETKPYKHRADNIDALVNMILIKSNTAKDNSQTMLSFLYRDKNYLATYAKCLISMSLFREKEMKKFDMVKQNIEQYLVQDDENQTAYLELNNSSYWWSWYGSEYEIYAYYLKMLALTEPTSDKASRIVKYLVNNRKNSTYWNSTRDTALCIEAIADFIKASKEDNPNMELEILIDGKLQKTVKINQDNLFSFDNKLVLNGEDLATGKHTCTIRKHGTGPLYYNAYLSYFSLEDYITKAGLEIKVQRKYYKLTKEDKTIQVSGSRGQAVHQKIEKYKRTEIAHLATVQGGDLVEIELEIDSKNDYEYILFEDMKAAGFEPMEVRSGYNGNEMNAFVEFRDEKVCFFVRKLARGKHSISYRMKAEIPGIFSALPTKASAMYAPELKANSNEIKIKIVGEKNEN